MPKVGIDLRMVRGRLHGIARYALELACRLPALAPRWEFWGLTPPDGLPDDLGPLTPRIPLARCPVEFLSPFEQPGLAASLVKLGCDLFHATSFSLPALWPGRLVATLHDANHVALPEHYGPGRIAYYKLIVGPRARRAKALLTVSEFSRQELGKHLGIDPYRFQVISPGVDPRFAPSAESDLAHFRAEHRLPPRYFAAVGNAKPHKNLGLLARIAPVLPLPLVLLAGEGTGEALGFPETTRSLSALSEAELPLLYGGATALLLPSLYEGFGLPALEAMACGCPVVASDRSSLPEVVGEAGLLRAPDDDEQWLDAAQRLHRDEHLRRDLAEKGRERAARMTWDECARRTLVVYRRALDVEG